MEETTLPDSTCFVYVYRCRCGRVTAARWDDPAHKEETERRVGAWRTAGKSVERLPFEELEWCDGRCEPAGKAE